MTSTIQIRTDKKTKDAAKKLAESLGMNLSTTVNIFLKHFVVYGGLPFEVKNEKPLVPSKKLEKILAESEKDFQEGRFTTFTSKEDLVRHFKKS